MFILMREKGLLSIQLNTLEDVFSKLEELEEDILEEDTKKRIIEDLKNYRVSMIHFNNNYYRINS